MGNLSRKIDTTLQWGLPRSGVLTEQAFQLMDAWRSYFTGAVRPIPCTCTLDQDLDNVRYLSLHPESSQTLVTDYKDHMVVVVPLENFLVNTQVVVRLVDQPYNLVFGTNQGPPLPITNILSAHGSGPFQRKSNDWSVLLTYLSEYSDYSTDFAKGWVFRVVL